MEGDGSGFSALPGGKTAWGRFGAAGLFLRTREVTPHLLLQHRAPWTHAGGTWALPGGARDSHETAVDAALREAVEETGIDVSQVNVERTVVTAGPFDADPDRPELAGGWSYTTVVASVDKQLELTPNEESVELRWVPCAEVEQYDLLPAFRAALPQLWHS
ncbi:NUDIX domain-containing protein [Corynebacterium tapiri]|uniref:NUDIX hydrolase n=1 Tax=Corynebacterium tapiri TaxID=1448266 RepID=A0A5C4U1T3_9CORY|nr:NUDIX hydrolase [Corynebacterium tapiri]TNL95749.1 NUDIX hydrolase [Corynebacterium tapiri]